MSDFTGDGLYSSRDIVVTISGNITYTIEDLHISIVAKKSLSANPNIATIVVYNLKESTRELLSNSVYDYANNESVCDITLTLDDVEIYSGNIINVIHSRKPQAGEYETVFYCGDGANGVKTTATKKYAKGTNTQDIVSSLIGDLNGLTEGATQGIKDCLGNRTLLRSVTMDGKIISNIKKLVKDCLGGDSETDVYIEDGKVNIVARDEILDIPDNDITDYLLEAPKLTEQGANVTIMFDSTLKIAASFSISASSNQVAYANLTQNKLSTSQVSGIGTYKITEITHKIDNFSKEVAITELAGILNTKVTG